MNMSSMLKMGPTGGETFTVTCFACGMPSSKEWAQRVRSRPFGGYQEPFYPFLLEMHPPPNGAIVMEDGSTYLCAFCHALLESQWNTYEAKGDTGSLMDRRYIIHKFVCAVCGVETYRKRVRALPFQEFPFLMKARQPGSITLGNNPLAVVCLDCSETLWAQSAEYDRWGLPVQKRHFNWMARPPPPEDSVEATVARLPSGETQLPRCPPTDPLVPPKTNEPMAVPEAIPPVKSSRTRTSSASYHSRSEATSSSSSRHHHHHHDRPYIMNSPSPGTTPPRKSSLGGMTPPVQDAGSPHSQPPVVTVAPMSSQYTATYSRKNSMSFPSSASGGSGTSQNKYDSLTPTHAQQPPTAHGNIPGSSGTMLGHQQSGMYPSQSHVSPMFPSSLAFPSSPFPWPNLGGVESHSSRLASPYGNFGSSEHHPNVPQWPWLSHHGSPELLRYHQSYLASLQSRGMADPYFQSPSSIYTPSTTASYLPNLQIQQSSSIRAVTPPVSATLSLSNPLFIDRGASQQRSMQMQHGNIQESETQRVRTPGSSSSDCSTPPRHQSHHQRQIMEETRQKSSNSSETERSSPLSQALRNQPHTILKTEGKNKRSSPTKTKGDSSPEHRLHWKSKKSGIKKSSMQPKNDASGGIGVKDKSRRTEALLPKKRHWQPPTTGSSEPISSSTSPIASSSSGCTGHKSVLEKKRKFSTSALLNNSPGLEFTTRRKCSVPSDTILSVPVSATDKNQSQGQNSSNKEGAMDLSISTPTECSPPKFSIAYLAKSESFQEKDETSVKPEPTDSTANERNSVIVAAPLSGNPESDSKETPGKTQDPKSEGNELSTEATSLSPELENPEICEVETEPDLKESEDIQESANYSPKKDTCSEAEEQQKSEKRPEEELEGESSEKSHEQDIQLHVQFVTVGDIRMNHMDFIKKTVDDYVFSERKLIKEQQVEFNERYKFLNNLGLITPKEKAELELKILASRGDKNTIPPLKRRVKTPPLSNTNHKLEQELLKVAFDDPSLKQTKCDPLLSSFLNNLGLKPCTKVEKSRREIKWRQFLNDRLQRKNKYPTAYDVQRPWTNYNRISKLFPPKQNVKSGSNQNSDSMPESDPLTFLTLTLPPEIEEIGNTVRRNSSDLLTIAETSQSVPVITSNCTDNEAFTSVGESSRICIKYPKYIPSYALVGNSEVKSESSDDLENTTRSEYEKLDKEEQSKKPSGTMHNASTECSGNSSVICIKSEKILKIPVVSTSTSILSASLQRRRSSEPTLKSASDDSCSENDDEDLSINQSDTSGSFSELENILTASTAQWEKTKKVIQEALSETDYLKSKENQKALSEQAARFRTIRQHLKTLQIDMRETEKLFKGKEKQIMRKIQNFTKPPKKSKEVNANLQQTCQTSTTKSTVSQSSPSAE